jgi:hypothetical protein
LTDRALCDTKVLSKRVLGMALPSLEGEKGFFMVNKATIVFLISFFCLPFVSFAYETVEVRNGGSIQGIVEYYGLAVPQDKTYTLSSDVKYCGKELRTEKYLISADKGIKNVVVYLDEIKTGKAIPEETVEITDIKCTFVPHVSIGFRGSKFIVKNEDPVLHTIHVYTSISGKTMFNIGLPERGSMVKKTLTKTGLMELNCDCHPWMQGYIYVFDHPYAAVSDESGKFVIENIPPGTYNVKAWHEALGTVELADVRVEAGKANNIRLQYAREINLP